MQAVTTALTLGSVQKYLRVLAASCFAAAVLVGGSGTAGADGPPSGESAAVASAVTRWTRTQADVGRPPRSLATRIAVDFAGRVALAGGAGPSSGAKHDFVTLRYDTAGTLLWSARYNGPSNGYDVATAVVADGDGNVVVAGESAGRDTGGVYDGSASDYLIVKYDATGRELWVVRYNGVGDRADIVTGLTVDGGGSVYVTGSSIDAPSVGGFDTLKYESTGRLSWVARYRVSTNSVGRPSGVSLDPAGNVIVSGDLQSQGGKPALRTVKYSPEGHLVWEVVTPGPGAEGTRAQAMCVDAEGSTHVTGAALDPSTGSDVITVKYDSAGAELWQARYNGQKVGFNPSSDSGVALAVDYEGSVYVAARKYPNFQLTEDALLLKYDRNGHRLWVRSYPFATPRAVALDESGDVYLSLASDQRENLIAKYRPHGAEVWLVRLPAGGGSSSNPVPMAVDRSRNVYAGGLFEGANGSSWFALTKVSQAIFEKLGGGEVRLQVPGDPGEARRLQATGDFQAWEDLGVSVTDGLGALQFEDADAVNFSHRSYRLLTP